MRSGNRSRRGFINVWVALTLFVLVGLVGLACDCGWVALVLAQLQTGADAAALAGAARVKSDQSAARAAAITIGAANHAANAAIDLQSNDANAVDGDIVIGRFEGHPGAFTATTTNPNAVLVNARRTDSSLNGSLNLVFGPAFGMNTANVERQAIAINGGFNGGAILVLDPSANCALSIGGNSIVTTNGGGIQVNSSNGCAACSNGGPTLNVPDLFVHGGSCMSDAVIQGNMYAGASVVPDPLAGLPAPPPGPNQPNVSNNNDQTINPGHFHSGIKRNGGNLTMNQGVYYLDKDFDVSGGANITGNGVMIYLAGSAAIDFRGNGTVILSPATSGTYAHVTIFQAHGNTSQSQINGTDTMHISGTLYFPSCNLDLRGTGDGVGNQIIANTLSVSGNANLTVNYNGAFPNNTTRVFLVK
jgi:Flp pilus assembly protein TadG